MQILFCLYWKGDEPNIGSDDAKSSSVVPSRITKTIGGSVYRKTCPYLRKFRFFRFLANFPNVFWKRDELFDPSSIFKLFPDICFMDWACILGDNRSLEKFMGLIMRKNRKNLQHFDEKASLEINWGLNIVKRTFSFQIIITREHFNVDCMITRFIPFSENDTKLSPF